MIERRIGAARAVWTDRHGGVSSPPYDTANVGDAVGDVPEAVAENRRRLAAAATLPAPERWFWLRQVHGSAVAVVREQSMSATETERSDAAVTDVVGLPLAIVIADCAPIALATDDAVGVVHAGWRGLVAGVVEAAVSSLREIGRGPVRAVLGPCIHPAAYEFGAADLARLAGQLGPHVVAATAAGRPAFDLPAGVRGALRSVGVESVEEVDVCTARSADHYSYRREGATGRQALVVVRER